MQQTQTWEQSLLALAYEALHPTHLQLSSLVGDHGTLEKAYAHCESLTAVHSRSFHMASSLLPKDERRAVRALYAFCRVTDDIVDDNPETAVSELKKWRQRIFTSNPHPQDLVPTAWTDARIRYQVPVRFAEQLVDGVARDLTQTRYANLS